MEEFEELAFVVPAYTPETMPLDRLLEYLQQVADVLGAPKEMHLIRIEASSTKPILRMNVGTANEVRQRAEAVRLGRGTEKQRAANSRLKKMLQKDRAGIASVNDRSGTVIQFFPEEDMDEIIASVRQPTSFDGILLRIGGANENSTIQMQDFSGDVMSGFLASRSVAKEMGRYLFEPLRVAGPATWERNRAGNWKLTRMFVQHFEKLEDHSIESVLGQLRGADVKWPDNADDILSAERQ